MTVEKITENKDRYMDLLVLGDAKENRIHEYLDSGDMFLLSDDHVVFTVCVVVKQEKGRVVLKNLATSPWERGHGYGTYMLNYICEYYSPDYDYLYVESKNEKQSLNFYHKLGFETVHMVEDENMVCLRKHLDQKFDKERVVNLAAEAGRILLQNGGEIFRVQETITYICNRFHLDSVDTFTISHGIFLTAGSGTELYTRVKEVPSSTTNLEVVSQVNQLSREISEGKVSIDEAEKRLKEIDKIPPKRAYIRVLSATVASGAFGLLLGATFMESILAGLIGGFVYACVLVGRRGNLPKILLDIMGGALITALAILAKQIGIFSAVRTSGIISGAIMPLIPGMAFVTAIREIAGGDFLSGTVRMIDAMLVFVYIAVGVGLVLSVCRNLFGGILL